MKSKRKGIWAIFLPIAAFLFVLAYMEPTPGRHSWFTGLAGDWAIVIHGTGYEIGNSPTRDGTHVIWYWKYRRVNGPRGQHIKEVVRDVSLYGTDGVWIVARAGRRWVWINAQTGELYRATTTGEVERQAPPKVVALLASVEQARPSLRYKLEFLGLMALLVSFVVRRRQVKQPVTRTDAT